MSKSLCFIAGRERYLDAGNSQPMMGLRKSSNNWNNKENEFREAGSMAEGQAFPSKDPGVRKVSDRLGARIQVEPVGEAGRSSAQAEQGGVPGEQANPVCYQTGLGSVGQGAISR